MHAAVPMHILFDNTYARLPERMYSRQAPVPVAAPRLVRLNASLAGELGLDEGELRSPAGVAMLGGNLVPDGAEPLAQAYAGHQFGHFVPQLGDGRAILLGEVIDTRGARRDLQLKGSGRTRFSRGGDGRAALGPVLREYIIGEAMHALGIATTRALAAVLTSEPVYRERPLPGAILTRVAASHIRVGTFQFFAARDDVEGLRLLADHAMARHDPAARAAPHPYRAFLDGVIARQADLIARWMLVGFIHGVMNTDNCTISGETIDYGPCAFLDTYHPATVFSSIDHNGRYAFGNQPAIAQWNLTRLAETLLPLLGDDEESAVAAAHTSLEQFAPRFHAAYRTGMGRKLGLRVMRDGDVALADELLSLMAASRADYTNTFRGLARIAAQTPDAGSVAALVGESDAIRAWAARWCARIDEEPGTPAERAAMMRAASPAFIPRNHRVEAALLAAARNDLRLFEELLDVIARPYDEQPGREGYAVPPRPEEEVHETFCGT